MEVGAQSRDFAPPQQTRPATLPMSYLADSAGGAGGDEAAGAADP
jgi:hypothetical protein